MTNIIRLSFLSFIALNFTCSVEGASFHQIDLSPIPSASAATDPESQLPTPEVIDTLFKACDEGDLDKLVELAPLNHVINVMAYRNGTYLFGQPDEETNKLIFNNALIRCLDENHTSLFNNLWIGKTPLHIACKSKNSCLEIVDLLLQNGANPKIEGTDSFMEILSPEEINRYHQENPTPDKNALLAFLNNHSYSSHGNAAIAAARTDNVAVMQCLQTQGISLIRKEPSCFVIQYLQTQGISLIKKESSCLWIACQYENINMVGYLISQGADCFNERERNLLIYCISQSCANNKLFPMVEMLIKNGGSIQVEVEYFCTTAYENIEKRFGAAAADALLTFEKEYQSHLEHQKIDA